MYQTGNSESVILDYQYCTFYKRKITDNRSEKTFQVPYLNKFMKIFAVLFKHISGTIQSINCLKLGNTNEFVENLHVNYI